MSWRIKAVGIHSDIRRVLDGHTKSAIDQGCHPDLYVALAAAAASLAQHVGHGGGAGGVEVTLSGHAASVAEVSVKAWDVKAAGEAADARREQEERDRADQEARERMAAEGEPTP